MRSFTSDDGRKWMVWVQDAPGGDNADGIGWETVLFDAATGQRVVHRPAGWLTAAVIAELRKALADSEPVRARWGELERAG